jgi:hypothetical protein
MSAPSSERRIVFGKSIAIGVLLVGIAAVIAALASAAPDPRPVKDHSSERASGFQLVQLGELRRDQFLLDGKTGRVWVRVCSGVMQGGECSGQMLWEEMCVQGVTPYSSSICR